MAEVFTEEDFRRVITLRDLEHILHEELHKWPCSSRIPPIMQEAYYRSFRCEKKEERTISGTFTEQKSL